MLSFVKYELVSDKTMQAAREFSTEAEKLLAHGEECMQLATEMNALAWTMLAHFN
ncbi:MAG: hypothetical protein KG075_00990 [Alphaproteobacteria bacterium]|nr:hypothetical protein [Alphaproteobacteria bacterium]